MIKRFVKFGLVGISGIIIGLGTLYFFIEFVHLGKHFGWFLATILAIFNNFTWNNLFTFKDRKTLSENKWERRLFSYYLFTLFGTGLNYLWYYFLLRLGVNYLLAAASGALIIGAGLNFYLSNWIIWKAKS